MQREHRIDKKTLTFGEFIARVREVCNQREGRNIVRHAVNTRKIVFRAHPRVVVGS
jgi:hypothetical protein